MPTWYASKFGKLRHRVIEISDNCECVDQDARIYRGTWKVYSRSAPRQIAPIIVFVALGVVGCALLSLGGRRD